MHYAKTSVPGFTPRDLWTRPVALSLVFVQIFEACGKPGEQAQQDRQMLLFSATMPPWVDKV